MFYFLLIRLMACFYCSAAQLKSKNVFSLLYVRCMLAKLVEVSPCSRKVQGSNLAWNLLVLSACMGSFQVLPFPMTAEDSHWPTSGLTRTSRHRRWMEVLHPPNSTHCIKKTNTAIYWKQTNPTTSMKKYISSQTKIWKMLPLCSDYPK